MKKIIYLIDTVEDNGSFLTPTVGDLSFRSKHNDLLDLLTAVFGRCTIVSFSHLITQHDCPNNYNNNHLIYS